MLTTMRKISSDKKIHRIFAPKNRPDILIEHI